jgi:Tol biopolymer transport system component
MFDGSKSDVWIHDLETETLSRLTTRENVTSVDWSADGKEVLYSAGGNEARSGIWRQAVDAAAPPDRLLELATLTPNVGMSPDGRWLVLSSLIENTWDVLRVALDSARRVEPFAAGPAHVTGPRLSPDGRWVALVSNESGTDEVYVHSFPEPAAKIQVSAGEATGPMWSADGTRLYYVAGTTIMQARFAPGPTLRVVSRDTAFARVHDANAVYGQANFDVSRDGSRIVTPIAESGGYQLVVVPNWITEFRGRMAAGRTR